MEKINYKRNLIHFTFWTFITITLGIGAGLSGIYLYISPNLPSIESLRKIELQTPLRIYSSDNKLIGEFGEKRRDPIQISDAPQQLIDAIVSAEDNGFYDHGGVDIKGLFRAASELALSGSIQSGGSTITMQVARNFFLSREQTFSRKFNEIFLALKIEKFLSKPEILELYLNKIYLGNRSYGVKAAAQVYYGKELNELTVAQIAMIAGLPKAPSSFNPIANPSRALIRRNWILRRMLTLGKLSEQDYEAAINEPVSAKNYGQNLELHAPYVAENAREKAVELFGQDAYTNGYKVYTTVDSHFQQVAQEAVIAGLMDYDLRHGYRGPEQQFDPSLLEPLNTTINEENNDPTQEIQIQPVYPPESIIEQIGTVNLIPWISALRKISRYGDMYPAAVIRIGKRYISVLTDTGKTIDIPWENGLSDAKPYVNENFAGDSPTSPDQVVKIGDVVRIMPLNKKSNEEEAQTWKFTQTPDIEAALISIRPSDGAIKSMVGGFHFDKSSFNRALQAKRQPGSNFKPIIYAAALEDGMTPGTIINDAPIVVQDNRLEDTWRPQNASGKFYGPTRIRKALYLSRNLISIRLLRSIGIEKALASIKRFGIDTSAIPKDLSMALGSHVMTPLEVASAYSVFANGGYLIEPYLTHHITDRYDEVVYKAEPSLVPGSTLNNNDDLNPINTQQTINQDENSDAEKNLADHPDSVDLETKEAVRILDERIAYLMNSMLQDVINRGTATKARSLKRSDLAGKTGTTNGPIDAWFSGYNAQLVTTTWVGFDDNKKIGRGEYGGVAALPIWIDFMKTALDGIPSSKMPQPDGIVTISIDSETGQRTLPSNPNSIEEIFLEDNTPPEIDIIEILNGAQDNPAPEELF